ncbi:hypothetical protein ACVWYF_001944 [Hymenobacter sp. UYAg731]
MDQYSILKTVHKVGHPISGVVTGYYMFDLGNGWRGCNIEMKTTSAFKSILPYSDLFDEYDYSSFDETLLPAIGSKLDMVVSNYVDGTLYLSAKPSDVDEKQVADFVNFYKITESLREGEIITGKVSKATSFGLFIELPFPYWGLIEIINQQFSDCELLPYNPSEWPLEGENIACKISSFRFHNRQIDLCWLSASL